MGRTKQGDMPWGRWVQGQPRKKFLKPSRRREFGHFTVLAKMPITVRSARIIKQFAVKAHQHIEDDKKLLQKPLNPQQQAAFTKRHEEVAEAYAVLSSPEDRERYERMYASKFFFADSTHRVRRHRGSLTKREKGFALAADNAHVRLDDGELPPQFEREYKAKRLTPGFKPWNGQEGQEALMMLKGKPQLKFIKVVVVKQKYTSSANKKTLGKPWYIVRFDPKKVKDKRYSGQLCVTKDWLL